MTPTDADRTNPENSFESTDTAMTADTLAPDKPAVKNRGRTTKSKTASPTRRRIAILVLGMHRSGTSAITRVINLLGADLPSRLMPAVEGNNEAGFWESLDIYRLNDEILESAGSRWDDWRRFNPDWFRSVGKEAFKARARAILEQDFARSSQFVLKDPRICRLLPFWLEVLREFDTEPKCVISLRSPLEIAASLKQRDGFSPAKSHMLWLRHVLDAEHGTRGWKRTFVSYRDMLDDWRGIAAEMSRGLDVAWPRLSATAEVEIDRFLEHRHRHHALGDGKFFSRPDVAAWMQETYLALSELQSRPNSEEAEARLDTVRSEFNRASDALGAVLRSEEMDREALAAASSARIAELEQSVSAHEALVAELEDATMQREGHVAKLENAAECDRARVAELENKAAWREGRVAELENAAECDRARVAELENKAAWREGRIAELENDATRRERQIDELENDATRRERRIDELEQAKARGEERVAELQGELISGHQKREESRGLRNQLVHRLNGIQTAASWQLASTLYALEARWPRLVRGIAALPRLAWWTLTLRLPQRLRLRRQAKHLLVQRLFDLSWYVEHNPDIVLNGLNPVMHWLVAGWKEGRDPNPLFDCDWYLAQNRDVAEAGINPLIHYLARGAAEGRDPNPLFDTEWYLANNLDVSEAGTNPLAHYLASGSVEGRDPCPSFDTDWYLADNVDVAEAGLNPLAHYLAYGEAEGRKPNPLFDTGLRSTAQRPHGTDSGVKPLTHSGSAEAAGIPPFSPSPHAAAGLPSDNAPGVTTGSYGNAPLHPHQLYRSQDVSRTAPFSPDAVQAFETATGRIIDRYLPGRPEVEIQSEWRNWVLVAQARAAISAAVPRDDILPNTGTTSFSIITPYYRHIDYFSRCADSVGNLFSEVHQCNPSVPLEWIVVNDDPEITAEELKLLLSPLFPGINKNARVFSDGTNQGIAVRLNQGAQEARHEWLLFLDCDDRIIPQTIVSLLHYQRIFPRCRYISSSMIDIDENDVELRRRIRSYTPLNLIDIGMIAGHLVAIRRDFFDELGGFRLAYSGCQDYDLALRAAIREPLLLIPDFLYQYRWHSKTQSVHAEKRQNRIADRVLHNFISHSLTCAENWDDARYRDILHVPPRRSSVHAGLCVIRTQGRRLDLLLEAILSVEEQEHPLVPCVVVHGNNSEYELTRSFLNQTTSGSIVLHANDTDRLRGFPLNLAIDYLSDHSDAFDYYCILDDDDILYPMFTTQISDALALSEADIVYCMNNRREPWKPAEVGYYPLPTICLLAVNFIPINAYVIRSEFLLRGRFRFREDLDYLEDWDLLVTLLQAEGKFEPLWHTLSEFRIFGDGNREVKNNPNLYRACAATVNERCREAAATLGCSEYTRHILDFDFGRRPPLTPDERFVIRSVRDMCCATLREPSA